MVNNAQLNSVQLHVVWVLTGLFFCVSTYSVSGQSQEGRGKGTADLIVDGRVDNVFKSDAAENEFLVQILVQRSEAIRLNEETGNMRFPAPGEYVYAHVEQRESGGGLFGRTTRGSGTSALPAAKTYIRALLSVGQQHRWEGSGADWFETLSAVARPDDRVNGRVRPDPRGPDYRSFGIATERVSVGRGNALKVTRVEPESSAAQAGIEVGDVLVQANGSPLSSPEQLAAAFRKTRGTLTLTVRDVRTGRDVPVDIKTNSVTPNSSAATTPSRNRNTRGAGITAELAFYEGEAAVKVTKVEPRSPAQRAGIVPGLLILKAGGKPMLHPDRLAEAQRNARGTLRLEVVDPSNRRKRVVTIEL